MNFSYLVTNNTLGFCLPRTQFKYNCSYMCYRNYLYNGSLRTDGEGPARISGLAWIANACGGKRRTSVNREFGQYGSTATAAHELGHKYVIIFTLFPRTVNSFSTRLLSMPLSVSIAKPLMRCVC